MTDKTNQEPTAQEPQFTPVDIAAYVQALVETLKDDETATQDLNYLLIALEAHAQVLAQVAGVQVVLLESEDGQFAIGLAPLQ